MFACTVLIGTVSPTQNFHTIAYGICSSEDTAAHKYVVGQVVEAVNRVVADYSTKQKHV